MGLLGDYIKGYGEPALGLLSGAVAEPVAGWAGILSGGDAGAVERTRNALTYQPQTQQGQAGQQALAHALLGIKQTMVDNNPPVNAAVNGYNTMADKLGAYSPALGAAAKTLPTAALMLAGPGSSAAREAIANVGGDTLAAGSRLAQAAYDNAGAVPAVRGPLSYQDGALNPGAKKALADVIANFESNGPYKAIIKDAIQLTPEQHAGLSEAMSELWKRNYPVPNPLDLRPQHGYESRVLKQGFTPEQYYDWLVSAADDASVATKDGVKPTLINQYQDINEKDPYPVKLTIRSDGVGRVYADGVIPGGIFTPKKK